MRAVCKGRQTIKNARIQRKQCDIKSADGCKEPFLGGKQMIKFTIPLAPKRTINRYSPTEVHTKPQVV